MNNKYLFINCAQEDVIWGSRAVGNFEIAKTDLPGSNRIYIEIRLRVAVARSEASPLRNEENNSVGSSKTNQVRTQGENVGIGSPFTPIGGFF